MGKAWKGRFSGDTDRSVEEFTESISFDHRLYQVDIEQSSAHATMLGEVGLISPAEAKQIVNALAEIREQIANGQMEFDLAKEDIHLHIESALIAKLGDVGRKLHTGRSRNDQIATDLRLWVRKELDILDSRLVTVQQALVRAGTRSKEMIIPAYTHLQRAQPVLAAHYFLAYVEKLQRDRGRVADCRRRVNQLPLGSAAVAGSSLPLNRARVAELLQFEGISANSIDATSDRDFVVETGFVLALIAGHLSGWAEEWILWNTAEFGFLELPDALCTGSSIMPQKKNPDVLELIRGKTARVVGSLTGLLVLIKGLPLAYNRDLQEDKPLLFDAMDTVQASLKLAAQMIENAKLKGEVIGARLDLGFLDATTLMERLIALKVPMRTAHEMVGQLVRRAETTGARLADLADAEYEALLPGAAKELKSALGAEAAVASYLTAGSSAPSEVAKQLEIWQRRLEMPAGL